MSATPWQRAIAELRAALGAARGDEAAPGLPDEARLRDALARALALCVPPELRDALARRVDAREAAAPGSDAHALATRELARALEEWESDAFAERALGRSVEALPGVGPKRAHGLAERGLGRVVDLLFHLPQAYDDRRSLEAIGDLRVGQHATVIGTVRSKRVESKVARGRAQRVLEAVVGDDTGTLVLRWFRASDRLAAALEPGVRVLATGDVRRYRFAKEMVHPELERLGDGDAPDASGADASGADASGSDARPPAEDAELRVVPAYACPEGVAPRTFRTLVATAVERYSDLVPGWLPDALARDAGLPAPGEALRRVHAPEREARVRDYAGFASPAHERLVLEELYLLELGLALRHARRARAPGIALDASRGAAADAQLPFALTAAQARALAEIRGDLARPSPMSRLLQGDVGSGKTAVAFLAAVTATADGHQAAFMAPTELLAEQHARSLARLAAALPAGLRPRLARLTASLPRAEADAVRARLARGEVDLVVGTHALVQDDVRIPRLALAIVDEQHRFGVRQRAALAARGEGARAPHALVMTATPIPRTLALTLYGDLDVSVIDALPPGRAPTATWLAREGDGKQVAEALRAALDRGEQAYVVFPLVEESEKVDLRSAVDGARRIARAYPDARVDLVHGRLSAEERAAAMARFESGETRILVSTTVIEVGVDVANATLMIVEHAERFGLAQLHQLRGRVGRGGAPGTCVLVARGGGEESEARLRAMLETTDGFRIADADLRIRGPGEFLGTRQSGHLPSLRVADLVRDARLVARARNAAFATVRADPALGGAPGLLRAVEQRWGERLALAGVG
ncbi:MAG: ATP-dependent DNA helicase RecG [Myxococcota bacterium]